jgi:hypothetical protein
MNHVAQRNQSGTMFSRDRGRRATYSGVTDREQGSKLFVGELSFVASKVMTRSRDYSEQSCVVNFAQAMKIMAPQLAVL